jgi:hypothetical protein
MSSDFAYPKAKWHPLTMQALTRLPQLPPFPLVRHSRADRNSVLLLVDFRLRGNDEQRAIVMAGTPSLFERSHDYCNIRSRWSLTKSSAKM